MGATFFYATYMLTRRELLRFVRQRGRLIGALGTPLLFWLLIGGGIGTSFSDAASGSKSYLEFFFPGTIVLSVLFTAIFSTMSVIEDRHEGFLQGVLVSPNSRCAFLSAKILGGALLGTMQGVVLLFFSSLASLKLGVAETALTLALLFLMAAALTALGFAFAWKLDSVQGYHGIMNMVLLPMWILSGSLFPVKDGVLGWLTRLNPLTYGVSALRAAMNGTWRSETQLMLVAVLVLTALALALAALSARLMNPRH